MYADDAPDNASLLARAAGGDLTAWGALLAAHQERLAQLVAFRLDRRLCRRIDPSDVIQDAFVSATARRAEFFGQSTQPLFLWLRWMVGNTLLELHRHHLGVQMRDARRETLSPRPGSNDAGEDNTRAALIAQLTAGVTGPATAAARADLKARLNEAMDRMDAIDREVLALRHFEQLTTSEAAQVLGIQEDAAAKRYMRALVRLREMLADMPGGLTGLRP